MTPDGARRTGDGAHGAKIKKKQEQFLFKGHFYKGVTRVAFF
jgi:hypothetical protein